MNPVRTLLSATFTWLTRGLRGRAGPVDPSCSEDAPQRDELLRQAQRCRRILKSSIVDFYLSGCIDRDNGGYLENLRDNRFVPTGEKFLTMQGRQLWFFSTLVREGIETDAALAAARAGIDFLQDKMLDRRHGGYFAKVSDAGRPTDRRKHVYLNAFALFGLVAFYRATADEHALTAAKHLFHVLEEKAHDRQHGGYLECFAEDWSPPADRSEHVYVGPAGMKTYNTHLHALEALTALYQAWPDPVVRERLTELVVINAMTVRHPQHACNLAVWHPDWRVDQSQHLLASYGHDVECVWMVLDAVRFLGFSPWLLQGWAEAMCGYGLRFGYDTTHGGFFYAGPPGQRAADTNKEWWVQAEALIAMLEMYRLTKEPRYYSTFRRTLDFIESHQVASEGSWWATCAADGTPKSTQRSSMWQGAYHSGRSMIRCAKLLEDLAAV